MVRINTNLPALMAWRHAGIAENKVNLSMERLATGLRIVRASDDPSNLGVSERMRSQIHGHSQAIRNVQQEISLLQTAEGALQETHDMTHRIRELLLSSLDGTKTAQDRMNIQEEIDQLLEEIDSTAQNTSFNRKRLLDGSTSTLYSSDKTSTDIFPRDSIRTVDDQGNVQSGAGNYEIRVRAEEPGTAQVQQTNTFYTRQDENVVKVEGTDGNLEAVLREELPEGESIVIELEVDDPNETTENTEAEVVDGSTIQVTLAYDDDTEEITATIEDVYEAIRDISAEDIEFNGEVYGTVGELVGLRLQDGGSTAEEGETDLEDPGWFEGEVAPADMELQDIGAFWDQGTFLLEDSQKLTLYQGDGSTAKLEVYGNFTVAELAQKIGEAIYEDLDQGRVVSSQDQEHLVTYVEEGEAEAGTHESVEGTMVIRSGVVGRGGEIYFGGNENMLNAMALDTLQESKQTTYRVDVQDAHDGSVVAEDVKISGNELRGEVHPNVDVRFDNMADLEVQWDEESREFTFSAASDEENVDPFSTKVHLANNALVAHIGPGPGQDLITSIGRMDTAALGIDSTLALDNKSANLSLARIDTAIDRVSSQRARIGSMVNRLEHTLEKLMVGRENLTASESLIRDVDVPRESMELVKNQIKRDTSLAMLSHANLQHQRVFSLLFGIE